VLKNPGLPLNFSKVGFFAPNFAFWTKIFRHAENFLIIFRQPKN